MGFKKMTQPKYPPRLWSLIGYPRSGKSTFASQLKGPMVVIDADHRFTEVMNLTDSEIYQLSDNKADNVNPSSITKHLSQNMPGSGVQTIVVDSLTAIIAPLVVQAMIDNDDGKNRNKIAAFRTKALAMRQLQDAVTRWGCDVLWIYHLQDSRDAKANEVTRSTISGTEEARLNRSINMQMHMVEDEDNGRRGIKVIWARRGRTHKEIGIIWDDTGCWRGMPEKLEEAIYGGLSKEEQDAIEEANPDFFASPEEAVNWAIEKGAFKSPDDASKAYTAVKKDMKPKSAREMAAFWVDSVEARVLELAAASKKPKAAPKKKKAAAPAAPVAEEPVF